MAREFRQVLHQRHVGAECREPHGCQSHRLERLVPALLPRRREIRRIHADHAQQRVPILARHRPQPEVIVAPVERLRHQVAQIVRVDCRRQQAAEHATPEAAGESLVGQRARVRVQQPMQPRREQRSDVRAERRGVIRLLLQRAHEQAEPCSRRLHALATTRPQRVHQALEPFPVVGDRAAPQFAEQRLEGLRCIRVHAVTHRAMAPYCPPPAGDQNRPPPPPRGRRSLHTQPRYGAPAQDRPCRRCRWQCGAGRSSALRRSQGP